ncbi:MAG: endonuclease [Solirubrobacterales bacterium]|nr:endonuclease [Solirubrobacterales bacterium]
MEWLASKGAQIWLPIGHSPDVDLMADLGDRLVRVQVKTSTLRTQTSNGHDRWNVSVATKGGNRSWSGTAKVLDPAKVDSLFVLVGDGRRWFIPAALMEGTWTVTLGGVKYSEFEVEPGLALESLVFPDENGTRMAGLALGECQSGQMDATVNRAATPTQVRILPPPSTAASSQVLLRPKRQATIPKRPCEEAGLRAGDRLRVRADGPGRVIFERIDAGRGEQD